MPVILPHTEMMFKKKKKIHEITKEYSVFFIVISFVHKVLVCTVCMLMFEPAKRDFSFVRKYVIFLSFVACFLF